MLRTLGQQLRTMTSSAANKTVKIEIVSDTACPWCYIGKKRLEVT